ncbi:hypothetical protein HDU86_002662 [Geranomyces michiganensis]|nr:hypothetical protein HDU86_002662 [Geranomyces michiganensis]
MSLFDQFEDASAHSNHAFISGSRKEQPSSLAAAADSRSVPVILEQGYVSTTALQTSQQLPVFSLDRVQFPFPVINLASLAVASNTLVIVADAAATALRKDARGGGAAGAVPPQRIYRIDLGKSDAIDEVEPMLRQKTDRVRRVFLDPAAKHMLISTEAGDNFYLYCKWKKPRLLSKFRGILIESVAWGKPREVAGGGAPTSTGVILIGTRQGHVFEAELVPTDEFFKREERYFRQVYSVPDSNQPVCSIRFEEFPAVPRKYIVFLATATRLYQFIGTAAPDTESGGGSMFTDLFKAHDGHGPNFQEIPGDVTRSELQFWSQFVQATGYPSVPKAFTWLTSAGLFCGDLTFGNQFLGDSVVNNAQLLPYPRSVDTPVQDPSAMVLPISVNITEFHYLLLYENAIKALNILTNEVDYDETIPLEFGEFVLGLFVDRVKCTYWVATNLALYELIITDEDRDVWRIYLERKSFDAALAHAKSPAHKDTIVTAQAEYYYSQGRYMLSATYFAQCVGLSFEEIVLKFIEKDERGALQQYLLQKLARLKSQDAMQVTLISTWLVEIFINRLNVLQDQRNDAAAALDLLVRTEDTPQAQEEARAKATRLREEEAVAIEEFKQFLQKYKARLDLNTVSNIIGSHGRTSELLYFLELMGDFDKVVTHWIQERDWQAALGALARQNSMSLFYKFSPVLIENAPFDTVNAWIRQPNLNPRNLIPALLRYENVAEEAPAKGAEGQNQAIRYLTYVTRNLHNTDAAVHNYLLSLYVSQARRHGNEDDGLLQFLHSQKDKPCFDLQYALRLCAQYGLAQASVHIYGAMNLHEQAVDLALKSHDLELAQINAEKPEDDDALRKKLWLQIARHVVEEKRDIKQALAFLSQTSDLLKIEDILPFFPDFILIDDFKDEICAALEDYNDHIEELKAEMDEATNSAESIRLDIRDLRNRYTAIAVTESCYLCRLPLLTRQFYVFPCEHVFHADCLTGHIIKESPPVKAARIKDLQARIARDVAARRVVAAASSSSSVTTAEDTGIGLALAMRLGRNLLDPIVDSTLSAVAAAGGAANADVKVSSKAEAEALKEDLDELVAAECPLCGDLMIRSVDRPFIAESEGDVIRSWQI